jgi:hypothetical protein
VRRQPSTALEGKIGRKQKRQDQITLDPAFSFTFRSFPSSLFLDALYELHPMLARTRGSNRSGDQKLWAPHRKEEASPHKA